MLRAMETGKIPVSKLGLRSLRSSVAKDLGMKVDISVVRTGGAFDTGPYIPLGR